MSPRDNTDVERLFVEEDCWEAIGEIDGNEEEILEEQITDEATEDEESVVEDVIYDFDTPKSKWSVNDIEMGGSGVCRVLDFGSHVCRRLIFDSEDSSTDNSSTDEEELILGTKSIP
jgi:hypothetical protein